MPELFRPIGRVLIRMTRMLGPLGFLKRPEPLEAPELNVQDEPRSEQEPHLSRQTEIPADNQHDGRPAHMNPSKPG